MRNGWNFLALRTVWVFYLCHIVNLGFTGWVWIQKFILWQLFCIYTLPVNWQYDTCSGMCKHIPWGYFQLSTCVEVATPSVTKDLGFHVLIRKMRVSSRFNMRKFDIILSFEVFFNTNSGMYGNLKCSSSLRFVYIKKDFDLYNS